jgi:uncharacterized protein (TIGR03083 family)
VQVSRVDGYHAARRRIATFVSEQGGATPVPACPAWSVHDLIAHLSGTAEALTAGDMPPPVARQWIDRLVVERRLVTVPDMLERWAGSARAIGSLPKANVAGLLADIVVHEHDLRGALGCPGARDEPALREAVMIFLRIHAGAIERAGLAPLAIGRNDSGRRAGWYRDLPMASHEGRPGCTLHVDDWEATRVLSSRRTRDEMRALPAHGDLEPYMDVFEKHAPLPEHALDEGSW